MYKFEYHCLITRNPSVFFVLKKWADYLISEVRYDKNHLILMARRHEDTVTGIGNGDLVDRIKISSDIANGLDYNTIYNRISTWKNGNKIHFFRIHGEPFLRIDENKVNQDYLGDLPELEYPPIPESEEATPEQFTRLKQLEIQTAEFEAKSSQKTQQEPPQSPRGSLPKESKVELPQELDLEPEPILEPEEATPEQIARLKQLEKQISKLESKPRKKKPKPEEATPEQIAKLKQLEKQISKLESQQKEPEPEEATPEQIARLKQLEKQISKLESKPRKKKPKPEEATPEQIARLKQLEKQISKLESKPRKKKPKPEEATPEQIARLKQLETQISKLESQK